MDLFECNDYKKVVHRFIESQPRKGRGQLKKMAEHLRIHPVVMTQIFNGPRDLNLEQAFELSDFMGFSHFEREYFLKLVERDRAGTQNLKDHYQKKIEELREQSQELKNRVTKDQELSESAKAVFYSQWYYSGIRLATGLEKIKSIQELSERLGLEISQVNKVMEFLVEQGLVVKEGSDLKPGPQRTHLEARSPLVGRHHSNWRIQAMRAMEKPSKDQLFFTAPMRLDEETYFYIRKELVNLIESLTDQVVKAQDHDLACLNIDLFTF